MRGPSRFDRLPIRQREGCSPVNVPRGATLVVSGTNLLLLEASAPTLASERRFDMRKDLELSIYALLENPWVLVNVAFSFPDLK